MLLLLLRKVYSVLVLFQLASLCTLATIVVMEQQTEGSKWLAEISCGLNLSDLSSEFEGRGFVTKESLKYIDASDLDVFFPLLKEIANISTNAEPLQVPTSSQLPSTSQGDNFHHFPPAPKKPDNIAKNITTHVRKSQITSQLPSLKRNRMIYRRMYNSWKLELLAQSTNTRNYKKKRTATMKDLDKGDCAHYATSLAIIKANAEINRAPVFQVAATVLSIQSVSPRWLNF